VLGTVDRGMGTTGATSEKPMPWWGLVVVGVVLVVTGVLALLAYSYWGWERRVEAMAAFNPPAGVFFVVWGLGRGARGAARRIRSRREPLADG
jgi:hypothetical protein